MPCASTINDKGAYARKVRGDFLLMEDGDEGEGIDYEVIRNQRFMIETARDFIKGVEPWRTAHEEVEDETCITIEEFNKWRSHLLKILGVAKGE